MLFSMLILSFSPGGYKISQHQLSSQTTYKKTLISASPNPLEISMVNYAEKLNRRLLAMISSMEEEGIADERLGNARNLKEVEGPYFFVELIPKFLSDSQSTLDEMEAAIAKTDLDFSKMFQLNMKLKGTSACLGASSMTTACQKLSQAIDEKSKRGCLIGFDVLKSEYMTLHQKLDVIVELERRILS